MKKTKRTDTIFLHLPAYRDPELIPTIKDAIAKANRPENLRFGICHQYHPDDKFDNLDEFKDDSRFKIDRMLYTEAKGLPYARQRINDMITDETYILQLDSHHRFAEGWDDTLINMHSKLEKEGFKPIITGYLPLYDPFNDPAGRSVDPWLQHFVCFYPHGTIFIRPSGIPDWKNLKGPVRSRFLSGHFDFARTEWAKTIKHDPDIYFSGEEINLTLRSFTHGYDFFHPHVLVIWHSTMREERAGKLSWDDEHKRGVNTSAHQARGRAKIRQLFRTEDNGFDLTGYDIGTVRTIRDYEEYAGFDFKLRSVQQYTLDYKYPPNPKVEDWEASLCKSYYNLISFDKRNFKLNDYQYMVCAYDDENGMNIQRQDIQEHEIKKFMEDPSDWVHLERHFLTDKKPYKWVIWAYSKSQGWAERIEHIIDYSTVSKSGA